MQYNEPVDTAHPINKYLEQLDDYMKFSDNEKDTLLTGANTFGGHDRHHGNRTIHRGDQRL